MSRTILITGASSGIGAAVVRRYVHNGYHVAALARRMERLQQLAKELEGASGELLPIQADVLSDVDLAKAVELTHAKWGLIDTVYANAGFGVVGPAASLDIVDYQRQFDTNIFGVVRTLRATIEDLKKSQGRFAITGSVAGFISLPGGAAYSMSKFAIRALCEALYLELKPFGIAVIHIAPGFVKSEIHQVDNQGRFHAHAKHRLPDWALVPAQLAAREIVRAIEGRKRQKIITGHGKILVVLEHFFPWLVRGLVGLFAFKARDPVVYSKS